MPAKAAAFALRLAEEDGCVLGMRLILASASPRRAELLRAAGFEFGVHATDVDETVRPGEAPAAYVLRLAEDKARVVAEQFPTCLVLAADTTVVVDELILGKPIDVQDAKAMLTRLSGRSHEVLTGVALLGPGNRVPNSGVVQTSVEFSALTPAEIDWYIRSGEPMDKAGAYGIQGLASRFVTAVHGSYSNVVGLPVDLVYRLCNEAGLLIS